MIGTTLTNGGKKMRLERKWTRFMTAAAAAVLLFASCSSHGGGKNSGGPTYAVGGNSPSAGAETTTATYTSYDSAGGYLNIEGGHYQTCTLTGNSTGGTITLSNGTQANLTGTYGTPGGSTGRAGNAVSLAADSIEIKIEGCWTITFNGATTSYTYSLFATVGFLSIQCIASNGSKLIVTAGAATDSTHAPAGEGVSIAPGSVSDPFAGTAWGITSDGYEQWYFENGAAYSGRRGNGSYLGPYTVSQTSEGYKLCFGFAELSINNTEIQYQAWAIGSQTITIQSAGAAEGSWYTESYADSTAKGKQITYLKTPCGTAYKKTS